MKIFAHKKSDIIQDAEIPDVEQVSEMLVKRDSFFHSCWMILKSKRPDIWSEMTGVELYVSGHNDPALAKGTDEKNNDKPSPVVL